jgi:hypothetical protein
VEDKRACPHCGRPLHNQPYLMAQGAGAPRWLAVGGSYLLLFVLIIGVLSLTHV